MKSMEQLLTKHGGYRNLKTFQLARLVFDITVSRVRTGAKKQY